MNHKLKRLTGLILLFMLSVTVISAMGSEPLFFHAERSYFFHQDPFTLDTSLNRLLVNNSFAKLGFWFSVMILDYAVHIDVSALSISGQEIITVSLLLLDNHNSTHLKAYTLINTNFFRNVEETFIGKSISNRNNEFTPGHGNFISKGNFSANDIISKSTVEGTATIASSVMIHIKYYRDEIEIPSSFMEELLDLDEFLDLPLLLIFLPLVFITAGDPFLGVIGFLLLLMYVAGMLKFLGMLINQFS